jgi:hypothetical protein
MILPTVPRSIDDNKKLKNKDTKTDVLLRFNDQPFLFKVPGCGLNSDANSLKSI